MNKKLVSLFTSVTLVFSTFSFPVYAANTADEVREILVSEDEGIFNPLQKVLLGEDAGETSQTNNESEISDEASQTNVDGEISEEISQANDDDEVNMNTDEILESDADEILESDTDEEINSDNNEDKDDKEALFGAEEVSELVISFDDDDDDTNHSYFYCDTCGKVTENVEPDCSESDGTDCSPIGTLEGGLEINYDEANSEWTVTLHNYDVNKTNSSGETPKEVYADITTEDNIRLVLDGNSKINTLEPAGNIVIIEASPSSTLEVVEDIVAEEGNITIDGDISVDCKVNIEASGNDSDGELSIGNGASLSAGSVCAYTVTIDGANSKLIVDNKTSEEADIRALDVRNLEVIDGNIDIDAKNIPIDYSLNEAGTILSIADGVVEIDSEDTSCFDYIEVSGGKISVTDGGICVGGIDLSGGEIEVCTSDNAAILLNDNTTKNALKGKIQVSDTGIFTSKTLDNDEAVESEFSIIKSESHKMIEGVTDIYGNLSRLKYVDTYNSSSYIHICHSGCVIDHSGVNAFVTPNNLYAGGVDVIANPVSGNYIYNPANNTLTLDNFALNKGDKYRFDALNNKFAGIYSDGDLNIVIKNKFVAGQMETEDTGHSYYGIYVDGDLKITGENSDAKFVYECSEQSDPLDPEDKWLANCINTNGSLIFAKDSVNISSLTIEDNSDSIDRKYIDSEDAVFETITNKEGQIIITDSIINCPEGFITSENSDSDVSVANSVMESIYSIFFVYNLSLDNTTVNKCEDNIYLDGVFSALNSEIHMESKIDATDISFKDCDVSIGYPQPSAAMDFGAIIADNITIEGGDFEIDTKSDFGILAHNTIRLINTSAKLLANEAALFFGRYESSESGITLVQDATKKAELNVAGMLAGNSAAEAVVVNSYNGEKYLETRTTPIDTRTPDEKGYQANAEALGQVPVDSRNRKNGVVELLGAATDTTKIKTTFKLNKVKRLDITPVKNGTVEVTANAGTRYYLNGGFSKGSGKYRIISDVNSDGVLNKYGSIKKPKSISVSSKGLVTLKAVKNATKYDAVVEYDAADGDGKYTVIFHIENLSVTTAKKDIKTKRYLSAKRGDTLVVSIDNCTLLNGYWTVANGITYNKDGSVKSTAKQFANVTFSSDGHSATITPIEDKSGTIKLTYTVNGKNYLISVPIRKK